MGRGPPCGLGDEGKRPRRKRPTNRGAPGLLPTARARARAAATNFKRSASLAPTSPRHRLAVQLLASGRRPRRGPRARTSVILGGGGRAGRPIAAGAARGAAGAGIGGVGIGRRRPGDRAGSRWPAPRPVPPGPNPRRARGLPVPGLLPAPAGGSRTTEGGRTCACGAGGGVANGDRGRPRWGAGGRLRRGADAGRCGPSGSSGAAAGGLGRDPADGDQPAAGPLDARVDVEGVGDPGGLGPAPGRPSRPVVSARRSGPGRPRAVAMSEAGAAVGQVAEHPPGDGERDPRPRPMESASDGSPSPDGPGEGDGRGVPSARRPAATSLRMEEARGLPLGGRRRGGGPALATP